jgi:regulator of protease activity HflC (stomatin/prohibitin superfamily)
MGLADWVRGLGIRAEQAAQGFATRAGAVPLQWPAGPRGSLIYRLPRDPHQRASLFATQQAIIVNEGEIAVVLEDGKSQGALDPGKYVFEKARVTGSLDIVWVATGQQSLKWGIGNVTSTDGIQLSGNGVVYVRVDDARKFNTEVVQGAATLVEVDLQRLLMPRLQGVLRTVLAKWPALELQTQRELFNEAVTTSLTETFLAMGLAIVSFEVVEVNFPPEFKAIIAQAAMSSHAGKAAVIEAQTRAQVMQLEAMGNAQAQLTAGMAQVQVMAQLQAQGIDPLKLKALDALQTFAANPSQGGVMIGGDAARAALFGQLAGAAISPGVPVSAVPALMGNSPTTQAAAAAPEVVAVSAAAPSADDLERQLDALTERLAEGKITEETYNKLSARLEGKLAQIRGA